MKRYHIELKWAGILAGVVMAWHFGEKLLGLHSENIPSHPVVSGLVAIPTILVYFFSIREKKSTFYRGNMSFNQGFMSGAILSIFYTLLMPLVQVMNHQVISPQFFQNMIDFVVENGRMTREFAETYFTLKSYIIDRLLTTPVLGFLTSGAIAFLLKTKPESGK
jgi:hypothetical protein